MKAEWNSTPEGVFGKTQLQKLRDGELRRGVCCGSGLCGGHTARVAQSVCGPHEAQRKMRDNGTEWRLRVGRGT